MDGHGGGYIVKQDFVDNVIFSFRIFPNKVLILVHLSNCEILL